MYVSDQKNDQVVLSGRERHSLVALARLKSPEPGPLQDVNSVRANEAVVVDRESVGRSGVEQLAHPETNPDFGEGTGREVCPVTPSLCG